MKYFFLLLCFGSTTFLLHSQEQNDSLVINQTISQLFEGMKTGDSNLVRDAFHPDVKMQTVVNTKTGETKLRDEKLQDFLIAVGTPHEGVWNEKITKTHIQIDAQMAHVWTDYEFYLDDKFIHCGVNSFQLVKLNNFWKIIYLIDTRRVKGYKEEN
ncbi:MAG: nuclear transport factor 2 family protein [Flavobacteriales bacterium]